MQGAGAPTIFQAMRRIVDCLAQERFREGSFERALRSSFLGILLLIFFCLKIEYNKNSHSTYYLQKCELCSL